MKRYIIILSNCSGGELEYLGIGGDVVYHISEAKRFKTIKEAKEEISICDNWNKYIIASCEIEEEVIERFNNVEMIEMCKGGYEYE